MGLEQIKKLPEIHRRRRENFKQLHAVFKPYEEFFILPQATEKADPSWFAFPLTIKNNSPFKRKDIVNNLENNKIQTRPYFAGNIMLQPAYDGIVNKHDIITKYPNARKITTDSFFLGTSPVIASEQIDYIQLTIQNFIKTI
jgi:CDP-6-deoxy-D-xylo-4-hexulose-3-dehydrase